MIRMKKLTAVVVSAAFVLAACGGDDDDTSADVDVGADDDASNATADDAGDDDGSNAAEDDGGDEAADSGDELAGSDTPAPTERGELLTLSMAGQPINGLAASQGGFANATLYFQTVYDTLLRLEPDGVTVVPHLATEWEYDDTRTVLTMTLRDDVTFSDGTTFDADAAAQNLIRNRDSNGTEAANLAGMVDAVAVDDTTLEITLDAPDPAFLNYMAFANGLMQSPATFDAPDEATNPIGSGPYVLDVGGTTPDSEYVYTARDDYWAPELQHWDEIVLRVIDDGTALVNALLAGELNGANLISPDASVEVEAAGFDLHTLEHDWAGFSLIDREAEMGSPLDNKLVRQAISHAIDREAILDGFGGGFGIVTQQVFRPDSPGYDAALDELYPYDPERARELMDESGVGEFAITLPASFAFFGEALYAVLADYLAEIGITVEYEEPAPGELISDLLAPKYPMYFMFLGQFANDWQFISRFIAPDAVWNPAGATDDTVVDLLEQIQFSEPGAERDAPIAELGAHIAEEAWFVPFYRVTSIYATDDSVDVTSQQGNVIPFLWNFVPEG